MYPYGERAGTRMDGVYHGASGDPPVEAEDPGAAPRRTGPFQTGAAVSDVMVAVQTRSVSILREAAGSPDSTSSIMVPL